jgi:hypothetical protein
MVDGSWLATKSFDHHLHATGRLYVAQNTSMFDYNQHRSPGGCSIPGGVHGWSPSGNYL